MKRQGKGEGVEVGPYTRARRVPSVAHTRRTGGGLALRQERASSHRRIGGAERTQERPVIRQNQTCTVLHPQRPLAANALKSMPLRLNIRAE